MENADIGNEDVVELQMIELQFESLRSPCKLDLMSGFIQS